MRVRPQRDPPRRRRVEEIAAIRRWILRRERFGEALEIGVRAFAVGAGRQSGDEAQAPVAAACATVWQQQPEVALAPDLKTPEMARRDPRNQKGAAADRQRPPDEIGRHSVLLGDREADDRGRLFTVVDTELASARRQSEDREELLRDLGHAHHVLRLADAHVFDRRVVNRGHRRERGRTCLDGEIVRIRRRPNAGTGVVGGEEADELGRPVETCRAAQEQRVEHAIDRGIRPCPQAEAQ